MTQEGRNLPPVGFKLDDGDELVTAEEIAQRFNVAPKTVEGWRSRWKDTDTPPPDPVNAEPGSRRGRHLYRLSEWRTWLLGERPPESADPTDS